MPDIKWETRMRTQVNHNEMKCKQEDPVKFRKFLNQIMWHSSLGCRITQNRESGNKSIHLTCQNLLELVKIIWEAAMRPGTLKGHPVFIPNSCVTKEKIRQGNGESGRCLCTKMSQLTCFLLLYRS